MSNEERIKNLESVVADLLGLLLTRFFSNEVYADQFTKFLGLQARLGERPPDATGKEAKDINCLNCKHHAPISENPLKRKCVDCRLEEGNNWEAKEIINEYYGGTPIKNDKGVIIAIRKDLKKLKENYEIRPIGVQLDNLVNKWEAKEPQPEPKLKSTEEWINDLCDVYNLVRKSEIVKDLDTLIPQDPNLKKYNMIVSRIHKLRRKYTDKEVEGE